MRGADFFTFWVTFCFVLVTFASLAGAVAFLAARVACFFSLTALAASSRIAFLRSSFWFFLVLLLVVSSSIPFLCLRLYNTVHVTLRGLRFKKCAFWLRPSKNLKTLPSALTKVLPLEG